MNKKEFKNQVDEIHDEEEDYFDVTKNSSYEFQNKRPKQTYHFNKENPY